MTPAVQPATAAMSAACSSAERSTWRGSAPVARHAIELTVNGRPYAREVESRLLLIDFLRGDLGLTGSHIGCDTTTCGACTVHVDGRAVKSCTMFAVQANGSELLTVEGLASGDRLHPVQRAFHDKHG